MTKLRTLLDETGESDAAFGRRLKMPRTGMTVGRWARGEQVPRPDDAANIIAALDEDGRTSGRLTLADIYGIAAPAASQSAAA